MERKKIFNQFTFIISIGLVISFILSGTSHAATNLPDVPNSSILASENRMNSNNIIIENNNISNNDNPVIVREQVKCVFENSTTEQKCYTDEVNPRFSCSGTEICIMDVDGKNGEELTWNSSCGEYAYTVTDGDNEDAEFDCLPKGNTTTEIISGNGFRYAYWQCYSSEEQKRGNESSCKSSEIWESYAKEFCKNKCYNDGSKCGVNTFIVTEECYLDLENPEVFIVPSDSEGFFHKVMRWFKILFG